MSDDKVEEEPKEKEGEDKKDGPVSATIDDVKKIVDDALEPLKKLIAGDSDSGDSDTDNKSKDKDDGSDDSGKVGARSHRSFSRIEQDAEKMVKDAVEKVLGEQEHKKEHEEIKKKQEPQKAPIKVRRLTKMMLGKDYGNE